MLDKLTDNKLYKIDELTAVLKEVGIPHNIYSIRKYRDAGMIKIGRESGSQKQLILGSEIKRFVEKYLKDIGAK